MFNLLAVTSRLAAARSELARLAAEKAPGDVTGDDAARIAALGETVRDVEARVSHWEVENSLRRHNHVGLVHAVLVEMAKQGELDKRIDEAKAVMKKKVEERKAKGLGDMDED
ncbi:hypothetical protein JCM11491_003545 [Sporobolomyces phaffii]